MSGHGACAADEPECAVYLQNRRKIAAIVSNDEQVTAQRRCDQAVDAFSHEQSDVYVKGRHCNRRNVILNL